MRGWGKSKAVGGGPGKGSRVPGVWAVRGHRPPWGKCRVDIGDAGRGGLAVGIELGGRLGATGVLMGLNCRSPAAHGLPRLDFLPLGVHARCSAGSSRVQGGVGPCQPPLSALTGDGGGVFSCPGRGCAAL